MDLNNSYKLHKNLRKYTILLVLFCFVVQIVSTSTIGINVLDSRFDSNEKLTNSYIIEFKEQSVLSFRETIKNNLKDRFPNIGLLQERIIEQEVTDHKLRLLSLHDAAKKDILNLLGDSFSVKNLFGYDFVLLTNSIVIRNIPNDVVENIKSLDYVKDVRLDKKISILSDNDPLSWGVSKIQADEVWELHDKNASSITGDGVSIAILDTGINYRHEFLGGGFGPGYKVVDGYDFVEYNRYNEDGEYYYDPVFPDDDPDDENGHGTHCAGIALGVAPGCSLYAYRVMNKDGVGKESWFLAGMERALDPNNDSDISDHVDIISLSLGAEGGPDDNLSKKVDYVVDYGVTVLAAAGNNGSAYHTITSPGCSKKAITVGNSDINDHVHHSSSRGPTSEDEVKPDIVAPGTSIYSTWLGDSFATRSGTSMSTPHVAGAAALLLQVHPEWGSDDIKNALKENAVKLYDESYVLYDENTQGAGRVNVLAAINLSTAPPIAKLNTSGKMEQGLIDITGTAMNGTGIPEDFVNFTLCYKKQSLTSSWAEIHSSTEETDDDVLFTWDTSGLDDGIYELKLFVRSKDQASFDISTIWFGDVNIIHIESPDTVKEAARFTVNLTDENSEPIKAVVLFLTSYHIPQIKYGSSVTFKAPRIFNPLKENISSRILVLKIIDKHKVEKTISITNEKILL